MKIPSGLSPLWLMSLALVLGTAIVVLIPAAIATGDPIKSSDWIGFAGNIVAGVMTLMAALGAWFAVQKQILAQQHIAERQMSIQAFDALTKHLEELRKEHFLQSAIRSIAMQIYRISHKHLDPQKRQPIGSKETVRDLVAREREDLIKLYETLQETQTRRWLLPTNGVERDAVVKRTLNLITDLTSFLSYVATIKIQFGEITVPVGIVTKLRDKMPEHNPVIETCAKYADALLEAERGVVKRLSESKKAIGI